MNIKSILTAGLIAVTGGALPAFAIPVNSGDLILGFAASSGTGSDTNLEVNLGAATSFTGNSTTPTMIASLGADLATYGADWNTRSDLKWGAIGYLQTAVSSSTLWGTKAETTVGTQVVAWNRKSYASQGTPGGQVVGLQTALQAATPASAANSALVPTINQMSWNSTLNSGNPGFAFQTSWDKNGFQNTTSIVGQFVVSDLFQMNSTSAMGTNPGTYLGSLGLDSNGDLFFATSASAFAAVPEPATYAAILGVLALGGVVVRRRLVKRA